MGNVGVEVHLRILQSLHLLLHLALALVEAAQLVAQACLGEVGIVGIDEGRDEQHGNDDYRNEERLLRVEHLQGLDGLVVKIVEIFSLTLCLLALHHQHVGIVARDEGRLQESLLLVGLLSEYLQCQLHHLVAVGGIDIRHLEQSVFNLSDAPVGTGQSVDAAILRQLHGRVGLLYLLESPARAHRHAVVLSEDVVDGLSYGFGMCLEVGFHGIVAALLGPIALQTGRHLDAGSAAHGLGKALAAVYRRRASLETFYLYYGACALETRGYVLAYLASHELVVGTDVGSELLGICFSVEHYHRYALVVGPVDGRSDGCHLVWRHDEQVDTERHEAVDLGYLRGIVVIGRC